jgi:hypothetical protein
MLRSLPFFNASKTDPQFNIEPKAVANGGSLYLGDAVGSIHKIGHDLSQSIYSWPAFTHSITHLQFIKSKNILLAIGIDDTAPLIKSFNLGKMDKNQRPELMKYVKISTGSRPFPITVLAVSNNMAQIAIGFENGVCLLIRGDVSKDRSVGQKIIHEASSCITGENCFAYHLGLGFHENAGVIHLFISTLNDILTAETTSKEIKKVVLDEEGCDFGCSIMSSYDNHQEMVVARKEAVYYYGLDGRGPCSIIEGNLRFLINFVGSKLFLGVFRQYLIVVSKNEKSRANLELSPRQAESSSTVSIFDLKNKFIAYSDVYTCSIANVIEEWNEIFILTSDKSVNLARL